MHFQLSAVLCLHCGQAGNTRLKPFAAVVEFANTGICNNLSKFIQKKILMLVAAVKTHVRVTDQMVETGYGSIHHGG